jgi:hypothetical protein
MGTFGGAGLAFSAPDRLLTLRYDHGETSLVELPFGPHGAIVGPSQTLFVWHGELISQLKLGGDRIGFSRGRANASVVRFGLAADGSHAEGTPKSVIDSSGSLRPLGWTDATHIAILEEHDDDFDHVVLASLDGAVEPYVPGPLRSAWLVPNGDVLYWAGSRANDAGAGSPDAGGCTLMRHVASDRSEHPAPQSGTTCDSPIRCARSRCIAQEAGEDLINTFRDWSSENGATGPILVQIDGPHIRWGLSSDGRWLAAYDGRDPALTLYDLAHDSARKVIPTRTPQMLQGVDFLPGARRLVVVGYGNAGKDMFGLGTLGVDGTSQTIATDPVVWSTSPQVAPDGRSFVVGRKDFGTKLWALEPR